MQFLAPKSSATKYQSIGYGEGRGYAYLTPTPSSEVETPFSYTLKQKKSLTLTKEKKNNFYLYQNKNLNLVKNEQFNFRKTKGLSITLFCWDILSPISLRKWVFDPDPYAEPGNTNGFSSYPFWVPENDEEESWEHLMDNELTRRDSRRNSEGSLKSTWRILVGRRGWERFWWWSLEGHWVVEYMSFSITMAALNYTILANFTLYYLLPFFFYRNLQERERKLGCLSLVWKWINSNF